MNQFDHLFYVRITESCNLSCDHCFIPKNPKNMTGVDLDSVKEKISKVTKEGETILIQFHGGEPTLAGIKKIRRLIDSLENDRSRKYKFSIQTNLMRLNDDWIALFHEHFDSEIGISWDYGIRKLEGSNEAFESTFWDNVKTLKENKIATNLVITTTKIFMDWVTYNSEYFFDKLVEHGIENVQLERITKVGLARQNWSVIGLSNREYSESMAFLYVLHRNYVNLNSCMLSITPFDDLELDIEKLAKGEANGGSGCLSGACDKRFHTIDSNGYKVGCTALNSEVDNAFADDTVAIRFFEPDEIVTARQERTASCESCDFNKICNTGCLSVTKLDESGECSGAKHLLKTINQVIKL